MNLKIAKALPALLIIVITGCGSHTRQLVAINISPVAADAQSFANGQVQFIATGSYTQDPITAQLTPQDITWCVGDASGHCAGFIQTGATVNASGLAQCTSGFAGIVTILAGQADTRSPVAPDVGVQLRIFGKADLTCP
jgi:hypothetical protein